jgi:hypothetical protein
MMVAKVIAEGKRLRLAMASQEGIIARWCGEGRRKTSPYSIVGFISVLLIH